MVAFGILNNRESALDIMQETYRQMIRSIAGYNSTNFMAWIATIARNLSNNSYNKNKRVILSDFGDQKYDRQISDERDDGDLFSLAKKLLDEESYLILVMVVVEGYKRREISKMLSLPISTVTYKYKSALKIIEEKLTKEGENMDIKKRLREQAKTVLPTAKENRSIKAQLRQSIPTRSKDTYAKKSTIQEPHGRAYVSH